MNRICAILKLFLLTGVGTYDDCAWHPLCSYSVRKGSQGIENYSIVILCWIILVLLILIFLHTDRMNTMRKEGRDYATTEKNQ